MILKLAQDIGNKLVEQIDNYKNPFSFVQNAFNSLGENLYYHIKPFKDSEKSVGRWISFLSNFSSLKHEIVFFSSGNQKTIKLYARVPFKLKDYFENTFYSNYSTAELNQVTDETKIEKLSGSSKHVNFQNCEFYEKQDFVQDGEYMDPFRDIFSIYYSVPKDARLSIKYHYVFDVEETFFSKLLNYLINIFKKIFLTLFFGFGKNKEDDKQKSPENIKDLKFYVSYDIESKSSLFKENVANQIKSSFDKFISSGKINISYRKKIDNYKYTEVVNFFHMLHKDDYVKNLDYITYRKLPYPSNLPTKESGKEVTIFGNSKFKNNEVKFGIKDEDKLRHMYIIGKTGTGKSTLISNMVRSDMERDKGLAIVDPHGDLIETVLEHVPSRRTNEVILFDVADIKHPIGINIFQHENEEQKNLIVSGVIGIFKKMFGFSWGPRLEYILRNVLLSVIEYPDATLMHVIRMLVDDNFRKEVIKHVDNSEVLRFWNKEFSKRQDRQKNQAIAPIINKVGQFLSSPIVRNIFGQANPKLDIREVMDEEKILLINLSKGKIGDDNMQMVGSFFITMMQIQAMARADQPHDERVPFYLYIDEFQNFATESFENILSEARKYKLSLIVANQYISQLDEKIQNAIFGNVGSIISFTLGYDDAELMSSQYKGSISTNDLLSMPKFNAYVKLKIDGSDSDPFNMTTFPLPSPKAGEKTKEKIRKQSRQRYGIPREKLEKLIEAWSNKTFSKTEKVMEKVKKQKKKLKKQGQDFNIEDIEIGKWYKGLVKLKYNYGIFVNVKGVEGLLHKSEIDMDEGVSRKDFYDIGSNIEVKAKDFKMIKGEKKVVWTQNENKNQKD